VNIGAMEHWRYKGRMKVGVIAEECNDVEVLYNLTCKLINENKFSFKKFVGHGCGKLRRKCSAWAKNLLSRGCSFLIVVHDLDNENIDSLRNELEKLISDVPFSASIVLIPVREVEAWLLTDPKALKEVFNLPKQPKLPGNPESIQDPKEKLAKIIWSCGKKQYVNTIHNKKIAELISIKKLKTCRSFRPYIGFVSRNLRS